MKYSTKYINKDEQNSLKNYKATYWRYNFLMLSSGFWEAFPGEIDFRVAGRTTPTRGCWLGVQARGLE